MVYYKKHNQKKKNISKKLNLSELLNTQKTKKTLLLHNILKNDGKKQHKKGKNHTVKLKLKVKETKPKDQEMTIQTRLPIESSPLATPATPATPATSATPATPATSAKQQGGEWSTSDAIKKILIKCNKYKNKLEIIYLPKMEKVLNKLNDKENKIGIASIQRMVNHILQLEIILNNFNKLGKTSSLVESTRESLKPIYNWYRNKWWKANTIFKEGYTRWSKDRNDIPKMINDLQDKIRTRLMAEISFDKVENLSKHDKLFKDKNSLFYLIDKYRFVESKYNKYNQKFHIQYLEFINTVKQGCSKLSDYSDKLTKSLEYDNKNKNGREQIELVDFTLCENYDTIGETLKKNLEDLRTTALATYEKLESQSDVDKYNKNGKSYRNSFKMRRKALKLKAEKGKADTFQTLSDKATTDFNEIFNVYIGIRNKFNTIFISLEKLGLHSYPSNVPKKYKKAMKEDIEMLSKNQTFINDFITMITPLKSSADEVYNSIFKKDTFITDLIPQIRVKDPVNPINILSIDMDLYREAERDARGTLIQKSVAEQIIEDDKDKVNKELFKILKIVKDGNGNEVQTKVHINTFQTNRDAVYNALQTESNTYKRMLTAEFSKHDFDINNVAMNGSIVNLNNTARGVINVQKPAINNAITRFETDIRNDNLAAIPTIALDIQNSINKIRQFINKIILNLFIDTTLFINNVADDKPSNLIIKETPDYTLDINATNVLCFQNLLKVHLDKIEQNNVNKLNKIKLFIVKMDNDGLIVTNNVVTVPYFFISIVKTGCKSIAPESTALPIVIEKQKSYTHYNAIFVKEDVFKSDDVEAEHIPIDQSNYFQLSNIDINETLEKTNPKYEEQQYFSKHRKSFAALTIMRDNDNGIPIVSTELIGSHQKDILYYKQIIGLSKQLTTDKGKSTVTGLNRIQFQEIISEIVKYTGSTPSYICGNLGVIVPNTYERLPDIQKTQITALFFDKYMTLADTTIRTNTPAMDDKEFKDYFIGTNRSVLPNDYYSTIDFIDYFENEYKFKNLTNYIIQYNDTSTMVGGSEILDKSEIENYYDDDDDDDVLQYDDVMQGGARGLFAKVVTVATGIGSTISGLFTKDKDINLLNQVIKNIGNTDEDAIIKASISTSLTIENSDSDSKEFSSDINTLVGSKYNNTNARKIIENRPNFLADKKIKNPELKKQLDKSINSVKNRNPDPITGRFTAKDDIQRLLQLLNRSRSAVNDDNFATALAEAALHDVIDVTTATPHPYQDIVIPSPTILGHEIKPGLLYKIENIGDAGGNHLIVNQSKMNMKDWVEAGYINLGESFIPVRNVRADDAALGVRLAKLALAAAHQANIIPPIVAPVVAVPGAPAAPPVAPIALAANVISAAITAVLTSAAAANGVALNGAVIGPNPADIITAINAAVLNPDFDTIESVGMTAAALGGATADGVVNAMTECVNKIIAVHSLQKEIEIDSWYQIVSLGRTMPAADRSHIMRAPKIPTPNIGDIFQCEAFPLADNYDCVLAKLLVPKVGDVFIAKLPTKNIAAVGGNHPAILKQITSYFEDELTKYDNYRSIFTENKTITEAEKMQILAIAQCPKDKLYYALKDKIIVDAIRHSIRYNKHLAKYIAICFTNAFSTTLLNPDQINDGPGPNNKYLTNLRSFFAERLINSDLAITHDTTNQFTSQITIDPAEKTLFNNNNYKDYFAIIERCKIEFDYYVKIDNNFRNMYEFSSLIINVEVCEKIITTPPNPNGNLVTIATDMMHILNISNVKLLIIIAKKLIKYQKENNVNIGLVRTFADNIKQLADNAVLNVPPLVIAPAPAPAPGSLDSINITVRTNSDTINRLINIATIFGAATPAAIQAIEQPLITAITAIIDNNKAYYIDIADAITNAKTNLNTITNPMHKLQLNKAILILKHLEINIDELITPPFTITDLIKKEKNKNLIVKSINSAIQLYKYYFYASGGPPAAAQEVLRDTAKSILMAVTCIINIYNFDNTPAINNVAHLDMVKLLEHMMPVFMTSINNIPNIATHAIANPSLLSTLPLFIKNHIDPDTTTTKLNQYPQLIHVFSKSIIEGYSPQVLYDIYYFDDLQKKVLTEDSSIIYADKEGFMKIASPATQYDRAQLNTDWAANKNSVINGYTGILNKQQNGLDIANRILNATHSLKLEIVNKLLKYTSMVITPAVGNPNRKKKVQNYLISCIVSAAHLTNPNSFITLEFLRNKTMIEQFLLNSSNTNKNETINNNHDNHVMEIMNTISVALTTQILKNRYDSNATSRDVEKIANIQQLLIILGSDLDPANPVAVNTVALAIPARAAAAELPIIGISYPIVDFDLTPTMFVNTVKPTDPAFDSFKTTYLDTDTINTTPFTPSTLSPYRELLYDSLKQLDIHMNNVVPPVPGPAELTYFNTSIIKAAVYDDVTFLAMVQEALVVTCKKCMEAKKEGNVAGDPIALGKLNSVISKCIYLGKKYTDKLIRDMQKLLLPAEYDIIKTNPTLVNELKKSIEKLIYIFSNIYLIDINLAGNNTGDEIGGLQGLGTGLPGPFAAGAPIVGHYTKLKNVASAGTLPSIKKLYIKQFVDDLFGVNNSPPNTLTHTVIIDILNHISGIPVGAGAQGVFSNPPLAGLLPIAQWTPEKLSAIPTLDEKIINLFQDAATALDYAATIMAAPGAAPAPVVVDPEQPITDYTTNLPIAATAAGAGAAPAAARAIVVILAAATIKNDTDHASLYAKTLYLLTSSNKEYLTSLLQEIYIPTSSTAAALTPLDLDNFIKIIKDILYQLDDIMMRRIVTNCVPLAAIISGGSDKKKLLETMVKLFKTNNGDYIYNEYYDYNTIKYLIENHDTNNNDWLTYGKIIKGEVLNSYSYGLSKIQETKSLATKLQITLSKDIIMRIVKYNPTVSSALAFLILKELTKNSSDHLGEYENDIKDNDNDNVNEISLAVLNYPRILTIMNSIDTATVPVAAVPPQPRAVAYSDFATTLDKVLQKLGVVINSLKCIFTTVNTSDVNPTKLKTILNNEFILNYFIVNVSTILFKHINNPNLDKKKPIIIKGGALPPRDILASDLYSREDIQKLFHILDTLLKNFSIGKKAYIQRDLGCFSFEKDYYETKGFFGKNKSKITNPSPYKTRSLDTDDNKKDFYTLNFPSFIEVLLNQKIKNYNSEDDIYYSENQYSVDDTTTSQTSYITPLFKQYEENITNEDNKHAIMDVAIRLLMIPSNDVKLLTGLPLKDSQKYNQVEYANLALKFSESFYKNVAITNLEKRLKVVLNVGKSNTPSPRHLIDLLLETKIEGRGENKQLSLVNIKFDSGNNSLIYKLYEYIMLMLKLKYYKYIQKNLYIPVKPTVGGFIDRRFIGDTLHKISLKQITNQTPSGQTYTKSTSSKKSKKTKRNKQTDLTKKNKVSSKHITKKNKKHTKKSNI